VNAPQVDGMTALHWAAYQDDTETGKLLLDAGANVKTEKSLRCNATLARLSKWKHGSRQLLLSAGADPNTTLRGGGDRVDDRTGRKTRPVKALLSAGAKVDLKEQHGQTGLMWAAAGGIARWLVLIEAGADFRTPLADSGFTPCSLL
jgi:ankyrin repeat protein